jgi:hypothetical protein
MRSPVSKTALGECNEIRRLAIRPERVDFWPLLGNRGRRFLQTLLRIASCSEQLAGQ